MGINSTAPAVCKRCKRCKQQKNTVLWLCRYCHRRTCEHFCGYKSHGTSMCQPCQRMIAENRWKERKS